MKSADDDRGDLKRHIRDNHPQVYLTLVSIIVALALEDLFSQVRGIYSVPASDVSTVLLWLQIAGAFFAAFNVWVGYCHILITSRWILGIWDALSVTSLLIFMFVLNSTVGASTGAWWLGTTGVLLFVAAVILYVNLNRAMSEPGNFGDALPHPMSWPVYHLVIAGVFTLSFSILVFLDVVGESVAAIFTAITLLFSVSWSFIWVDAWRKAVDGGRGSTPTRSTDQGS